KKKHGWFPVIVVLWCALFPLLYMIYKHSTVYDTWRHVFFVYPFWVVGAALSVDAITGFIKEEKKRWIPIAIAIAGLLPAIVWTVRSHPNQYVYFNELEGGAKGAYGYYDLDYYQNSGRQAANWMLKNLKPIPGRKTLVRSNMLGFNNYFGKDTSWIVYDYGRYTERFSKDWDYYVAYPRYLNPEMMQNNEWKLSNTVHTVSIDGVPLCVIVQRKSTMGIDAFDAYSKKDYPTAIAKFKEFLATDTTDEFAYLYYGISLASVGDMNGAIAQVNHAIKLDPSRAEFYDVLIQLYKATGNMQAAQQATGTRDELMMQQQPPQEEAE
ncbi:MAG: tetratricopeptide repeat protein, partial [Flavipsychrobacter sp.]